MVKIKSSTLFVAFEVSGGRVDRSIRRFSFLDDMDIVLDALRKSEVPVTTLT